MYSNVSVLQNHSAVQLHHGKFYPNCSKSAPHIARPRYMACLRVLCSDVLQVCVTAVFYAISCYIQSCYSGPACSVTIKREQTSVRLRHECCDQPAALQRQDDELLNSWSSSAWNAASYDFLSSLQSKNTAVGYRLWITIRWKSIHKLLMWFIVYSQNYWSNNMKQFVIMKCLSLLFCRNFSTLGESGLGG